MMIVVGVHAAGAATDCIAQQGRKPLSTLYLFLIAKANKKRYSGLICDTPGVAFCEWQMYCASQEAPVHDGGFGLSQLNVCYRRFPRRRVTADRGQSNLIRLLANQ